MTLPDRLSTVLSSNRSRIGEPEHRPTGRQVVQRGDIRRVEPCFDDPHDVVRLALVLTVDPDEDSVEIVLVHPYIELATETDLVFTSDETRAPYPVVVQTGIRSAVWTLQMRERVGSLSKEDLAEFGRVAVADDPFTVSPRTGPPLAGPADYRWNFNLQEIETLNHLAADRISAVFNDSLDLQWLSLVSQNPEALLVIDELAACSSEWTIEDLDSLQDRGVFDLNTCTEQFGSNHGRDLCVIHQISTDKVLARAA